MLGELGVFPRTRMLWLDWAALSVASVIERFTDLSGLLEASQATPMAAAPHKFSAPPKGATAGGMLDTGKPAASLDAAADTLAGSLVEQVCMQHREGFSPVNLHAI